MAIDNLNAQRQIYIYKILRIYIWKLVTSEHSVFTMAHTIRIYAILAHPSAYSIAVH